MSRNLNVNDVYLITIQYIYIDYLHLKIIVHLELVGIARSLQANCDKIE